MTNSNSIPISKAADTLPTREPEKVSMIKAWSLLQSIINTNWHNNTVESPVTPQHTQAIHIIA